MVAPPDRLAVRGFFLPIPLLFFGLILPDPALICFNATCTRPLASTCFRMIHFIFLLLFSFPLLAHAQVFMRPFDHAVAMGLGGATLAYSDPSAGFSNEAVAAFAQKTYAGAGSAVPYGITDWRFAQAQALFRVGSNSGAGIDVVHSGIDAYSEQRLRMLYGRRMAQNWSLGASADVLHLSAAEYGSAAGITFSIGFLARVMPEVWLASRIQNPLQQKLSYAPLPTVLSLGGAWRPGTVFTLLAEVEKELERTGQVKCGLEYRPLEKVVFRVGVRSRPARFALGAGLRLNNGLSIDAATEWHQVLGLTPSVMVGWVKK